MPKPAHIPRPYAQSARPGPTRLTLVPYCGHTSAVFRGVVYALAIESAIGLIGLLSFLACRGVLRR